MDFAFTALAVLVVIATLLPMLRVDPWWVRSLDFPRVQILALGALAAGGLLWARPWTGPEALLAGAIALALGRQVRCILPYTPLLPKEVRDGRPGAGEAQLSVLVSNVLMDNRRAHGLLAQIRTRGPASSVGDFMGAM